ncbi:hypothetical protein FHR24_002967 [Wenyingzhuangia heitensis]|uniref:Alginate lyase n=1 Tax=Wenyingzhuangia heitensis TaxID=1487859 RepID=A0ABX0UDQ9_9FLAO|nr:DUF1961 family protein [Wenyingzhuangia heitensis]NIJ46479.1 hypothetical protein [Wenyingzhuangia heitensis]
MKKIFFCFSILILTLLSCKHSSSYQKKTLLFSDDGTQNWTQNWMLDGTKSKVVNSKKGMELIAGPEHGNDTCHTVLWTKKSFKGNICIEYDYTKTDTTSRCVNILYFHTTGKGTEEYPTDISLWNNKRTVPHMKTYFNNIHTYHISYAAFSAKEYSGDHDYIRLRRYNPTQIGLQNTDVPGDHFNTGLFKTNLTYHIQVFKYKSQIEMHIQNKQDTADQKICKWDVSEFADCNYGRVGLRHMYTRSARYKNFKIWQLE